MTISVADPFDAARDAAMPTLALALDPAQAARHLNRAVRSLTGDHGVSSLRAIRVTRHKPGRRCMVEYDVDIERPDLPPESMTLIGKVRAGRYGKSGFRLLEALWKAGFRDDSPDGISVPEPIGVIGKLRMWLQRKVLGQVATELLPQPGGVVLATRIAEAAHKLHQAGVPTEHRHTIADELRILHEWLPDVAQSEGRWKLRIERVLDACERLGASMPPFTPKGIHRDFYADQVIVDGPRLYLTDFDLYCEGDPALDIGNFLGHLSEQSVRSLGHSRALADVELAMENRFVELSGESTRMSVRAYATLTLVRHVYLSTRFAERRPFTERLLELCEERLDSVVAVR